MAAAVAVSVVVSLLLPMSPATAHAVQAGPNLVANPSVETAESSDKPVAWSSTSWGTNTSAFSYPETGVDGTRSVRVDITSWSDGDAKWYFEPVPVTPGTEYVFHDHYQASVTTSLVVRYTLNNGAFVYEWLDDVAPSASWTEATETFTAPADSVAATVFHVIAGVGFLAIDDVYLGAAIEEPPPPNSSLVPNESFEQASANPNLPAMWRTNSWGANNATFEYLNEGRTGTRSVKTTVTNHVSGDAKWWFEPIPITAGSEYVFTDYYKSSVPTAVYAVFFDVSNTPSYVLLEGNVPASPIDWQSISRAFVAPAGAVRLSIYHVVAANGWLQLDDMTVNPFTPPPPPGDGNLIVNASLEDGAGSPTGWVTNAWGTNTASFVWETSGRTGSHSVTTNVTSYADGDAKWYFQPVLVEGGTQYTYSHYYRSNAATEAVAQYTHNDGSVTYEYLGSVPPSADWAQMQFTLSTPATARRVSVFHVLVSVGQLTIDDAFLGTGSDPGGGDPGGGDPGGGDPGGGEPGGGGEVIPNPSLETANGNMPQGWLTESWGINTSTFEYSNEGHTGSRSVKVTVSGYVSGDGKWYFEPIALEPGQQYRFSAWYRTNTLPHVVAMFTKANGSVVYYGMPDPQPSGNPNEWQLYSDSFTMPVDAVSASVFFFLTNNGWVQTDDYSISPYEPEGFTRPLVTLTFDDGHEDNVFSALPILESYGVDSTQCFATTFIEDAPDEQAAIQNVLAFRNAGHEICSHTVTHPSLVQLTPQQLEFELSHSKEYLESITGDEVTSFASPYGEHNAAVNLKIAEYYRTHRTVNEGF
ncbi:MAG TPA: polysaccharide deacetylase family protein, partial [Acidimicrobiales bacterium]